MDHAEARELLELASVEPGEMDRLTAGDTRESAALAGHLAGCPACTEELARLRRTTEILREVIVTEPPADLRERTLAFVRRVGIERPVASAEHASAEHASAEHANVGPRRSAATARSIGGMSWLGSLAAAIVVSVALSGLLTGLIVTSSRDAELRRQADTATQLARVATLTLRVDAAPDSRRADLMSVSGGQAWGSLVFSPSSGELVVVATGLDEPAEGLEYRCWLEVRGRRERVGLMQLGGGIAYWAGWSEAVEGVSAGATFGVSLMQAGTDAPGEVVLRGTL